MRLWKRVLKNIKFQGTENKQINVSTGKWGSDFILAGQGTQFRAHNWLNALLIL